MSYDDDHRGNPNAGPNAGRDRGAYTPPTDDDLPFTRGGYDPRRAPAAKSPPITLIISAVVLLLLIVAVVVFYRSGVRSSTDAPPAVGTPVESMKVEAPLDAQPVDPEADIRVYRDGGAPTDAAPTFTPGPEEVLPRPAPTTPAAPVESSTLPPAAPAPATKAPAAPAPATPAPATKAPAPAPAPAATGGSSGVQIGAFSSTAIADREYAAVAARFGQYASGAEKRVQEVTAANGSTVYRTTFTGMSRDRAVAFCNALKAAGRDCIVR
ncbi:SPOR domain-containing protein [Brevundimonas diminuta]|uniref:Sporulation protein n=1 Tax=Brevundimonas diminuta TaxID=293 RepID=A0A1Z3LZG2_BREDI|nr:SPOR domain-containing protein [Brevundimonas diminuta]ASD27516.1 sporulation protein [Brevundimonas diminuta]